MEQKAALGRCIELLGGQTGLAKRLTEHLKSKPISQATVFYWQNQRGGNVPAAYAIPLEELTDGQVKRWELRPDIYPPKEYERIVEASRAIQTLLHQSL